jgi:hypothetical protein
LFRVLRLRGPQQPGGSKYFGTSRAAAVEHATASSEGLSTVVFPTASAAANGANRSMNGSFQALIISVTPNRWRRTRAWPSSITRGVCTRCGFIHVSRCCSAYAACLTFYETSIRSAATTLRRRSPGDLCQSLWGLTSAVCDRSINSTIAALAGIHGPLHSSSNRSFISAINSLTATSSQDNHAVKHDIRRVIGHLCSIVHVPVGG